MAAPIGVCVLTNMWVKSYRPFYGMYANIARNIPVSCQVRLCLNYSTNTSAATSEQGTAQKLQETNESAGESNAESKDLSLKEKELLSENEKLLDSVKSLDVGNWMIRKSKILSAISSKFYRSPIKDKYKRALADNENIRNRMRREINDAKQFGIQSFVKDLIEVADVLNKATESVPKEALNGNPHLKSLFEGLQMTESQLLTVFKRHGVFPINPIGEKFNPNHHEALFEQEDSTKEAGTVGTVTQIGYRLHERIVRPAMVGVVKSSKV
ncbi:grpE protein homolog, mitochondrial-like isoform X1 [Uloborus diversus]|uniref:grpE protein homolog, mitochondrial-like isoform X1 n=1 Tax=Uloborus diversus TaxID=327109 RepID=UPI002409CD57|nr:grpE protein homolog, mitochondrial-like isoform X1 [Uloborus diversus]